MVGLARQASPSEVRAVVVAPGKVGLNLHFVGTDVLSPAVIQSMLQQLMQLAATVESLPQPQERLAPSSLEGTARAMSGSVSKVRYVALGFAGLTAVGIGLAGLVGVIAAMAGAF